MNPATCSYKNSEYLIGEYSIDDSVITCNKVVNAVYSVSTNGLANVMSTASKNFQIKKVRYKINCCILHTVL